MNAARQACGASELRKREKGLSLCTGFSPHACQTPYPASRNPIASSTSISRAAS